ncbi:MAG: hypothetical protein HOH04_15715, partial [Rhodospirillaceae bacterium]|nr:hypothetical protein [Rhodospirillaceae bacterium]
MTSAKITADSASKAAVQAHAMVKATDPTTMRSAATSAKENADAAKAELTKILADDSTFSIQLRALQETVDPLAGAFVRKATEQRASAVQDSEEADKVLGDGLDLSELINKYEDGDLLDELNAKKTVRTEAATAKAAAVDAADVAAAAVADGRGVLVE